MAIENPATRKGQAFAEFAVCLAVFSLVLCGLIAFSDCMLSALEIESSLRSEAGRNAFGMTGGDGSYSSKSAQREVPVPAAAGVFGGSSAIVKESVHMPPMKLD